MLASFPPTVVLRHRRENLKKCSLRGLETRNDFTFITYPTGTLPHLKGYVMLALDGPPLSKEDSGYGLFVLDATWRYAATMAQFVAKHADIPHRSIPAGFQTAYPRRQEDCPDPNSGLASIEAIYIAYCLLGRPPTDLLNNYYWRDEFLSKNQPLLTYGAEHK